MKKIALYWSIFHCDNKISKVAAYEEAPSSGSQGHSAYFSTACSYPHHRKRLGEGQVWKSLQPKQAARKVLYNAL